MSVVVAYIVLEAASKQQLEVLVKESISRGWQPLGGVAVSGFMFYQAMAGNLPCGRGLTGEAGTG